MLTNLVKICGNIISNLAWLGFLTIGFLGFFYIPWIHSTNNIIIFVTGLALSIISVCLALNQSFRSFFLLRFPPNHAVLSLLIVGVALRCVWVYFVPPIQLSDAQDYIRSAQILFKTGHYFQTMGGYELKAWRPPGYSFFLAFCMIFFGVDNNYIPFFTNTFFYILTCLVIYKIPICIINKKHANVSVLFLTLWPNYIMMTGLALVEPLCLFLLVFSVWAYFNLQIKGGWCFAILAGIATGWGALVKPAVIMIPFLWLLFHIMTRKLQWRSVSRTAIAFLCMIIVIAPWSIRNYLALGDVVLISTNGGDNFYRSNNPNATGEYSSHGEKDLNLYLYDEVLWNKNGFKWGKEWIKGHPLSFIRLIFKKQAILLGNDTNGVHWSLQRGHNSSGIILATLYLISNIWWTLMLLLAVAGVIKNRAFFTQNAYGGFLLLMTLFFVIVHSVFESQPRYHEPMIGFLAIFAALALNDTRQLSK